jgi:hypothetical protein
MNIFSWAFKTNAELGNAEIPAIFPLALKSDIFVKADILNTYSKILTDVAERLHGLSEEQEPLLWDSCVQSSANEGLITLLATAMAAKSELFIVYVPSSQIVRKATREEEEKIRKEYKEKAESKTGVYVSFKGYRRTDMLEIYSSFEYCVLASLNKTLNVAKSVQFKINDLRSSVSLNDSGVAREQAKSIAEAMRNGNDVLLDAKDSVESATPDTSPTEKAITFLDGKRAFVLGLPLSYVVGEQTPGIGSTGEADMRAVERGLRQYFVSIIRPVLEAVFKVEVEFKSQDFRQMTTALEVLKTFDLVSDDNLSRQSKQEIVARVFDLDPDKEEKQLEADAKEAEKEAALAAKNKPPVQAVPAQPNGGQVPAANGVQ